MNLVRDYVVKNYMHTATLVLYVPCIFQIVTQYYAKLIDVVMLSTSLDNEYKQSLVVSLLNNLPRIIFVLLKDTGTSYSIATVNGFTSSCLTLGMSMILLNTKSSCFVNLYGFCKEFFFMSVIVAFHAFYGSEIATSYNVIKMLALILFLYICISIKLRNLRTIEIDHTVSDNQFSLCRFVNRNFTKYVFNIIILDLECLNKTTVSTSVVMMISPIVNIIIAMVYLKVVNSKIILINLLFAFFFGCILVKCSMNHSLQKLNVVYGLSMSLCYMSMLYERTVKIISAIGLTYGLNRYYLDSNVHSLALLLPELITVVYFAKKSKSTTAVLSMMTSIILCNIALYPIKRLYSGPEYVMYYGNNISIVFSTISIMTIAFNYFIRNQKLSRDLGHVLLFNYFFYNLTFVLDSEKLVKPTL